MEKIPILLEIKRDAIKDATPNYVANPQYGQLHLIETRDLSRYLERYRTTSVKMWYKMALIHLEPYQGNYLSKT